MRKSFPYVSIETNFARIKPFCPIPIKSALDYHSPHTYVALQAPNWIPIELLCPVQLIRDANQFITLSRQLSEIFPTPTPLLIQKAFYRSLQEEDIFEEAKNSFDHNFTSANRSKTFLLKLIEELSSKLDKPVTIRTSNIRSKPDENGFYWLYPPASEIFRSLKKLSWLIDSIYEKSPMATAFAVYIGINWIHPVTDGNGRLSRIMFNLLLNKGGRERNGYLPIGIINLLSRGSNQGSLRNMLLAGNAKMSMHYLVNCLNKWNQLASMEARTDTLT